MSSAAAHTGPVGPDTLITVKVMIDGQHRRFKLALRDLGANTLPQRLRVLLSISPDAAVKFERFSDSAGTYIELDSNNPAIYKQLYRAAKAKLKLRLRATVNQPAKKNTEPINIMDDQSSKAELDKMASVSAQPEPRQSYLETVLSQPLPTNTSAPSFKAFQQTHLPSQPTCAIPGAFYTGDLHIDPPPRPTPRSIQLSQPTIPSFHDFAAGTFTIDCNNCGRSIPDEHFHCSICEKGDFDLCQTCVDNGVSCDGDDHWLLKRFVRNGIVINSITEPCPPRKVNEAKMKAEAYSEAETDMAERTCNSCISQLPASAFVTCKVCPDFDLCLACFQDNKHGHHPAHAFEPVDKRPNMVASAVKSLCSPGRGLVHQATCDGCNKQIIGVRHKCLACPDWDFCSTCAAMAPKTHPGHRFAVLYDPLGYNHTRKEVHRGIYCDGPLCTRQPRKAYIRGDRYKCAVCSDTDFCANCEAMPINSHNKTHPLIKMRTPIRHMSISTIQESDDGQEIGYMGDRPLAKNASTETMRTTSTNAATQVHTVAEVRPAEDSTSTITSLKAPENKKASPSDLQAWYESDSTPDGSSFAPNRLVSQSWTLRNPGPDAWPVGCAVHYIGGDDMRNLDAQNPSSTLTMTVANRSNVLNYSLEPGKTAVFTVLLKSPKREGRAISYWRLKTPEGLPFGHKLWVDINVVPTMVELPIRSASSDKQPSVVEEEEAEVIEQSEEGSTMIFPKLEKESPVSSTHDITETPAAVVEPTTKTEDQELLEEVESLELEDESDEDGFLTDEEYDILDASDEEFLAEAQQAALKK